MADRASADVNKSLRRWTSTPRQELFQSVACAAFVSGRQQVEEQAADNGDHQASLGAGRAAR